MPDVEETQKIKQIKTDILDRISEIVQLQMAFRSPSTSINMEQAEAVLALARAYDALDSCTAGVYVNP